ncbi:MAG: T9SS type A sorting domain-containing protein [Flavobacteriales bacterium]|nr:T9SS type A sorting domain-containing protein [Flavobacteriales bacterium]
MKKNVPFRKLRQFKQLSDRVNLMLESGEWQLLSKSLRSKLTYHLKTLYSQLLRFINVKELKKILASAIMLIGFAEHSRSQPFASPVLNPFGLLQVGEVPTTVDIDGDGDLDMFIGGGTYSSHILYYENTGTAQIPSFAYPLVNPFGLVDITNGHYFPAFADIDDDGDMDLFVGQYYGAIEYFENTGSPTAPSFTAPIMNPFGLTPPGSFFAILDFADIDNDGDMDLFSGEFYGVIQYYENIGANDSAAFALPQINPFGIDSAYNRAYPEFADIDSDGDLDLFISDYYGALAFYQNDGTADSVAFAAPTVNPFGLTPTTYQVIPEFSDIDNDGDLDLFLGGYEGLQYYENMEINTVSTQERSSGLMVHLSPNPFTFQTTLKFENPHKVNHTLRIVDMQGRLLRTISGITSEEVDIKKGSLNSGLYFYELTSEGKVQGTGKLVIE